MKCDQCEQVRINGIVCHEVGCPNAGRTWDMERQAWIKYVECRECGCDVEVGECCGCQEWEPEPEDVVVRCSACGATREGAVDPTPTRPMAPMACCAPAEPQDTPQWGLMVRMVVAGKAGREWAAGLKPGDEFLGADCAAWVRYPGGEPAVVRMFTHSAIDELERRYPHGVPLDVLSRITTMQDAAVWAIGVGLIDTGVQQ